LKTAGGGLMLVYSGENLKQLFSKLKLGAPMRKGLYA